MKNDENNSIASNERIAVLINEAESELAILKPEIEYLEQCQKKLSQLKDQQFKLNSLIISLKGVIRNNNFDTHTSKEKLTELKNINSNNSIVDVTIVDINNENKRKVFMPDQANSQVKNFLRTKNNLNYELFKAVVFNSGIATTQEIKNYLVDNNIKQPKSGNGFESVELKEISSRINYLVRKGILTSPESGSFRSVFGWCEI
jgi:hypothetical protein